MARDGVIFCQPAPPQAPSGQGGPFCECVSRSSPLRGSLQPLGKGLRNADQEHIGKRI
jgi:hypothetical protein